MDEEPSRPRLRGVSLIVARVAALTLSIGVIALIAAQAGLGGCRATGADIEAEAPSSSSGPGSPPPPSATSTAREEEEDPAFMGGAKAPAGGWARPRKPSPPQTAAPSQTAAPQGQK